MPKMIFSNASTQAIFDNSECGFDAFSDLMLDVAKKKQIFDANGNAVSTQDANKAIRTKMFEVLGIDETANRKEISRAIRRHKVDVFEVIEDTVESLLVTGWGENPFFEQFVEMKSLADGDANDFYTKDKVILTVSELAGNHHNLFRQRLGEGKHYSVKTSWYGIKIYAEYEQFISDRIDWAGFINKVYEAYDKKVNDMLYGALTKVGSDLPAGDQWVKTSALSAATKDTFMQLVEDVAAANGGVDVVVMGTRTALAKLTKLADVNWISDAMKAERNTTGRIGVFEGVTLFEIPQSFANNDTTVRLVDNTKLYVMPVADNKFIKMFNEGDARIKEISDGTTNVDETIEYEYQMKFGVATVVNRLFGIWTITE